MIRLSWTRVCGAAVSLATAAVGCSDTAGDTSSTAGTGAGGGAGPITSAGSGHGGMSQAAAGSGTPAGSGGAAVASAGSGGTAGLNGGAGRAGATGESGAGAGTGAMGGLGAAGSGSGSGGAAGTGTSTGGFGPGMLTLSNLKIEANPSMTLSCFVSWTTAEPAASEVDFGETDYTLRVRDAALVTDHQLLVIGMHAEKAYKIRAVSGNAQGSGSLEGTFTAGKLPTGLPTPKLNIDELPADQKGWTLTNIQTSSFSAPAIIVMYDEKGLPVWYFIHGKSGDTRGDVASELLPSNTVLVGPTSGEPGREVDLSGKILWEGPANSTTQLMSHFVGKTSKGNYLLNYELDKAGTSGSTKVDDQRLVELTPKNEVVWSWTLFDHMEPAGTKEELCHGNMLVLDEVNDIMYYNCRWVGLLKIDRKSGDILWRLGGTYDKTSLGPGDFTFSPAASQYSDTHEPELHADGTILFYDNGGYAMGAGGGNYHSRVVEYKVDETAKTATLTFEFPGDFSGVDAWYESSWYSPFWGDVDTLANGNILVTAPVKSASASTRFFEVTRQGKVVWELELPANNGSFKAQRLLPPPLVEPMP